MFSAACSAAEGPQIPSEDAKRVGMAAKFPICIFIPKNYFICAVDLIMRLRK
jgi:hypothetical protein